MKKENKIDYGKSVHLSEDIWFYPNPDRYVPEIIKN